ncbi:MAG TPA: 2-oxo acid dehydrogenase subunit E2 [Clostridiaceae bacterium]|nr:2-oxo acid dehydrogenase subunit E2 [Clostridiaceae bacterium]
MAIEVLMPKMGVTMEEGTILKWYKKEGDFVKKGDILFGIETDKATMDVESEATGTLLKILFDEGSQVRVTSAIAIIGEEGEDISELIEKLQPKNTAETSSAKKGTASNSGTGTRTETSDGARVIATPRARKLANEHNIDISLVKCSGDRNRITEEDVLRYLESLKDKKSSEMPYDGIRKIVGEKLLRSYQEKPHIYLTIEVDMSKLVDKREKMRAENRKVPSIADYIVRACAIALKKYPELNSKLVDGKIIMQERINIGYAVDTPKGLMVPVIKNVSDMSINEIAETRHKLVEKALNGSLRPDELEEGTFTISNLGNYGVKEFTAIINTPETAILAVGAIENRVVALPDKSIAVRPCMNMTISVDHRVVDGALAAKALALIKNCLENLDESGM